MKVELKNVSSYLLIMICLGLFLSFSGNLTAQDLEVKEIIIKVKPNIIRLPGGDAAKIPISAARIRSTELRKLNEDYNVVKIEKLFQLKTETKGKKGLVIKGFKDTEDPLAVPDLTKIFTNEIKKEKKKEGKQVVEIVDTFLFQLEIDNSINIQSVVNDYQALEVVVHAEYIVRN